MAAIEAQIDFSDVEDADDFTLERSEARRSAALERIDRALADRRFGAALARRLHRRHRRAAQCRQVDADERAGGPRRRDHLADSRNDPRSDRGVSRSSRLSGHSGRHRGHSRQPTIRSSRKGSRGRAAGPKSADLTSVAERRRGRRRRRPGRPDPGGADQDRPCRAGRAGDGRPALAISAKTGAGIDRLLDAIAELAEERMSSGEPALVDAGAASARLSGRARGARRGARAGRGGARVGRGGSSARRAAMERIVGRIGVEDVLGEIFSRLCVGK